MGNTLQTITRNTAKNNGKGQKLFQGQIQLRTWALSQKLCLDHDQLLDLRDHCLSLAGGSRTAYLSREQLTLALSLARGQFRRNRIMLPKSSFTRTKSDEEQDRREAANNDGPLDFDDSVIHDLYTVWDLQGKGHVQLMPFLMSLTPLACEQNETVQSFWQFAVEVLTFESHPVLVPSQQQQQPNKGLFRGGGGVGVSVTTDSSSGIRREDLIMMLFSMNSTLSMLGDGYLSATQISSVADEVVKVASLSRDRPSPRQNAEPALLQSTVPSLASTSSIISGMTGTDAASAAATLLTTGSNVGAASATANNSHKMKKQQGGQANNNTVRGQGENAPVMLPKEVVAHVLSWNGWILKLLAQHMVKEKRNVRFAQSDVIHHDSSSNYDHLE